ncbi:hypothetical protein Y032_0087g2023 [Ancylostoma ceylanicum]|uniref:Uncharacterized protein n=2 Tax=Ancylostoma ceylanicum TaxID=53326 RepID=A0A016TN98_9BILA|nr:hypothetical protein Y032_0087g2023 [Ancylostoma ceylanicum]
MSGMGPHSFLPMSHSHYLFVKKSTFNKVNMFKRAFKKLLSRRRKKKEEREREERQAAKEEKQEEEKQEDGSSASASADEARTSVEFLKVKQ